MLPKMNKSFHRLRGRLLFLALAVGIFCTSLLLWGWEKTPLSPSLPHQWRLDSFSLGGQTVRMPQQPGNTSVQEKSYRPVANSKPAISPEYNTTVNTVQKPEAPSIVPEVTNGCNYARGRWVPDNRRPLYSGSSCKRWLSPMWACRRTQRKDFSYEAYRWQPDYCPMPNFSPRSFLNRMKGRTIALVGDSLGRQQFQSLLCMVTGGKDSPEVEDAGVDFGLVRARGAVRPDGWAYRFPSTNTTILFYWSASLCELEPVKGRFAMHLDRPVKFLQQQIHRFDVLVLNTGHHWNRGKLTANRWDMYVGGAPLRDQRLAEIWRAKNLTLHSVVRWVGEQLPGHPKGLKAFVRSISPRHFVGGEWNSGGSCDNTMPLRHGDRVVDNGVGVGDREAASAAAGTGVRVLEITAISELRDEAHMSNYSSARGAFDCLHWCLPGVPDTWNEILFAQLLLD